MTDSSGRGTIVWEADRIAAEGLKAEWVLTNGMGGFAMGTVLGVPTRRYHGLLISAMSPPVGRVMSLSALDEAVYIGSSDTPVRLTLFHFKDDPERPDRHPGLVRFERGCAHCAWTWMIEAGGERVELKRTLRLVRGRNAAEVVYEFGDSPAAVRLDVRPLGRLSDMHELRRRSSADPFRVREVEGGCVLTDRKEGLHLYAPDAQFSRDLAWYESLHYRWETDRGQDDVEDLCSAGVFRWEVPASSGPVSLRLFASADANPPQDASESERAECERRSSLASAAMESAGIAEDDGDAPALCALAEAGADFIVMRTPANIADEPGESVIAGYPWFSDWGRDTMIALPGLLIMTGRTDEAKRVLETFAAYQKDGIIPNRFEDRTGEAEYNTVDASLWYVHAASELADATGDADVFSGEIGRACLGVIEAYRDGTLYKIGMDPEDGLIAAGDEETQLTWMDAQRDGVTFTPRHGKAVEINALWVHGLSRLARHLERDDPGMSSSLLGLRERAAVAFRKRFIDPEGGLFDRLEPDGEDWKPSRELRPNQLFAASLSDGPLDAGTMKSVVKVCREKLLTPMGLRTLAPGSTGYRPRFEGPMMERDAAYHNGTVWPWLIGAYVEALLRSESFSKGARTEARRAIDPLLSMLLEGPIPGQLPEVFDAEDAPDHPRRWDGCIAQAWTIAELLRALVLIRR
ncbi:MAG: glycogen debranching enzyme family protein [Phycisphaerales bacterium]|nr:glycogen debranching enzyme family protein [Phycisphaerales bacterium]